MGGRHAALLCALGLALAYGAWRAPELAHVVGLPAAAGWALAASVAWCAASALVHAVAYLVHALGRSPAERLLRGRARALFWALALPYRAGGFAALAATRLLGREPLLEPVGERLLVGGAPFFWDAYSVRSRGVDAVLNLSFEFGDLARLSRVIAYERQPWLDGVAPPTEAIERAASWIAARHREGRTVLVHCAQGHGRSALAAAAALRALGEAPTLEDAVWRVQKGRRGARIRGAQLAALMAWGAPVAPVSP